MKLRHRTTLDPSTSGPPRRLAAVLAGVVVAPLTMVATVSAPATADTSSAATTFAFTGGVQTWTAPAGTNRALVTLYGAAGESGGGLFGSHQPGGKGAEVTAVIAVTPGASYDVYVGGAGGSGVGGFNGGGSALGCCGVSSVSGGGGGATDLRPAGGTLDQRLLVAGGGGAGGGDGEGDGPSGTGGAVGGSGGDSGTGSPATAGGDVPDGSAIGGQGGRSGNDGGSGGAPGDPLADGLTGGAGMPGQGGTPGTGFNAFGGDGGGGGGGYVGGGAGGTGDTDWNTFRAGGGGGGGGGSDYVLPSAALSSSVIDGVRSGDGEVTISAFSTASAPTAVAATGGNAQATVSVSPPVSDGGSAITQYTVTAVDATNAARGGQTATGNSGPITITGLTNGDRYTFTVTATNAGGPGAPATSNTVTPSAPVVANKADLAVAVTGPSSAKTGSTVSYQVKLTNNGPAAAKSLTTVLAATGLNSLTANPATGTGTMTIAGTKLTGLRWTLGNLPSGTTITYTVTGTLNAPLGKTASILAATLSTISDPTATNNLATKTTLSTR